MMNSGQRGGSRRPSGIPPPLDEDTIKNQNNVNPGNFTLVPQEPPFTVANGIPSPTSTIVDTPMAIASLLQNQPHSQQQNPHPQAMQLEQDYLATRNTLQHCSRYVLLSVLTTLLDEYPMQLTVPIRMRLEQALMQRQGMVTSPNNNASNCSSNRKAPAFQANPAADGAAASWGNAPNGQTSNPISPYNNQSPNHRKPRHKNKEEDQELCSVHQSMRALKHLQKNPQTGLYECVHGFHCLVEGGSSPSKPAHQSYNNSASNHVASFNSGPPDQLKGFSAVHVDSNADADRYDEGQDLKELQDLLQSVRDMDEDE